jgi:S1-C subfamily serine protease
MVFTHTQSWLQAKVSQCNKGAPQWWIRTTTIEGGTSGGPVVDQEGRLLGVVSFSGCSVGEDEHNGQIPFPSRALPVWVVERITR